MSRLLKLKFKVVKTIQEKITGLMMVGAAPAISRFTPWLILVLGLAATSAFAQANDNFASAAVITGATGTTNGSNVGATLELPCETNSIVVDDYFSPSAVTASVWYAWTAPSSGTAEFDTTNSDFDTVLSVWTTTNAAGGLCDSSVTNIAADDDSFTGGFGAGGISTSALTFPAVAGTTYYISVAGYDYGDNPQNPPLTSAGNIVLNWNEAVTNANTGIIPSGNFQLTSAVYPVSSTESSDPNLHPSVSSSLPGARVTVTRTGGTRGLVYVNYQIAESTYTNVFRTNYYQTNITYTLINSNGIGFSTNISQYFQVFTNFYGYYDVNSGGYGVLPVPGAWTNTTTKIFNGITPTNFTLTVFPSVNLPVFPVPTNLPAITNYFITNIVTGNGITNLTITNYFSYALTNSVNGSTLKNGSIISDGGGNFYTNFVNLYTNTFTTNYYGQNIYQAYSIAGVAQFYTNLFITNIVFANFFYTNSTYTNGLLTTNLVFTNLFTGAKTNFTGNASNNVANSLVFNTPTRIYTAIPTNFPSVGTTQLGSFFTNDGSNIIIISSNTVAQPTIWTTNIVSSAPGFGTNTSSVVFNDYQMGVDLPTIPVQLYNVTAGGLVHLPALLTVTLTSATNDPQESADLIQPTVTPGPSFINVLNSEFIGGTDPYDSTISVLNIERENFRVNEWEPGSATIRLTRTGGDPTKSVSVEYWIDQIPPIGSYNPANQFALQAGSDYATPDVDFTSVHGTLTWGASDFKAKSFTIPIANDNLVEFNEDLQLQLYNASSSAAIGDLGTATVTIIDNNQLGGKQPSGAVDNTWNKNGYSDSTPQFLQYPGTQGGASGSGGNAGTVYAVAEQPDGKAIIAGSFTSFDSNPYHHIVRLLSNGYQDSTFQGYFSPWFNQGANDVITSVALQSDGKIIVGGKFTAYNGYPRNHIARLNADGSVDLTFNPNSGADGTVWSVLARSDGKTIIGGDFTHFTGTNVSHIARLNADGTLDPFFKPGNSVNGSVYALTTSGATSLQINGAATGGQAEDDNTVNLGSASSGTLTVSYDFLAVPDDMRIYYGGTNGVLIYDTGLVNSTNTFVLPFGPTNGLATNVITIVMNQGSGQLGTFWNYSATLSTFGSSKIYAGGAFDKVGGTYAGCVARFNDDGSLDTTFAPGIGTYNPDTGTNDPVHALALEPDGTLLVGGSFSYFDLSDYSGLLRLKTDGTVDTSFNPGTGTYNFITGDSDSVYSIALQPDGEILIGGDFTTYNETRRFCIARLFNNGSLDTSFMDTAYNQFAGLPNYYLNSEAVNTNLYPSVNTRNYVYSLAVEPSTTNVIIGGGFYEVGGGFSRDGMLPRSNVARLIGGGTPGPGNIEFVPPTGGQYYADKSAGSLFISMVRTNGSLGPISATFSTNMAAPGPGIASADDFSIVNPSYFNPLWPTIYDTYGPNDSWMISPAFYGPNQATLPANLPQLTIPVWLQINNNANITGNVNANLGLSNPDGSSFMLGGEVIGLAPALGTIAAAPLTIIDDNFTPGVMGFSSPLYTVVQNQGAATITITRTNGSTGVVNINYATSGGTAVSGVDYTNVAGTLTFNDGDTSKSFNIPIRNSSTYQPDKTVNLRLSNVTGGATIGLTNALLTIINNNFAPGHISFTATNYSTNETSGVATISVSRLGGVTGTIKVVLLTSDGSAVNGPDYTTTSNVLTWNNKNSGSPITQTITIPIFHNALVTSNRTVNLTLTNLTLNTVPTNACWGLNTNAVLTINNVDFAGTVQFGSPIYSVKKYGGYAQIPVVRTGGTAQGIAVDFTTVDGTALAGVDYLPTNNTLTFVDGQTVSYITVPILNTNVNTGSVAFGLILSNANPSYALGLISNATVNIIDTTSSDVGSVNETPGSPDVTYSPFAGFNGAVFSLALQSNNQLIAGGSFTQADGVPRQHIARLNADGSLDASFSYPSSSMGANDTVRAVAVQTDGRILVGGYFTNLNSVQYNRIARLNQDGSLDSLFNPGSGADSPVYALGETFVNGLRKIVVGGAFASLNGVDCNYIGQLNDDGTPDTTFNLGGLGANGTVYALAVQTDGKIVIGGDFTAVNNTAVNHVARLNVDGSLDNTFTNAVSNAAAGANNSVRAITIQPDGKILIGGLFTSVNGSTMNHLARLNTDGSLDSAFTGGAVGADDTVLSFAVQSDGRIVVGGQFQHCNNVSRSRITRLNPDGTVDPTINFGTGANDFVAAIVIQQDTIQGYPTNVPDEKFIIGGGFTQYFGQTYDYIARIYGGSITGVGAFEFSAANYQVDENGLIAFITVVRTGGTGGPNPDGSGDTFVQFATSNFTAIAGINYSNVVTNLDFPVGEVVETVAVPVIDDHVIAPDLTNNLYLFPVAPAAYGNQPTATLTIYNDDSSVSFSSSNYQVAKNVPGGVKQVDIIRSGSTRGTSTVTFNTTTAGTAVPITDYTPLTNVLVTFNPGVSDVVVPVSINNNGIPEGNQTIAMQLTNATGSTVLANPTNATLTILDTVQLAGVVFFSATNYNVSASGTNAYLTVYRTNGSSGTITVNYTTVAGTAQPIADYYTTNGQLTFIDGVTNQTIVVPLITQTQVKTPVSLSVVLSNPTNGATLGVPSTATVTISSSLAGISFVAATNTVPENSGFVSLSVQRLYNTNSTVTVQYYTVNGTAQAGTSYTPTASSLTFSNGEVLKSVSIPILDYTNATGDLYFSVNLTNPAGAQLLAPSNSVVVLQDAEAGLSFDTNAQRVLKNAGFVNVTVVCSNPRVEPVITSTNIVPLQVNYTTVNGTALAGTDYQGSSGTLVFTNGNGTNTFPVQIYNNSSITGDKAFSIVLSNPTAPGQITPYATQAVVIAESNTGLRFSQSNYKVFKNGIAATITVTRTGYTNSAVSVNYLATNGTAINGVNFTATNGTLVFTNGVLSQTFNVPLIANSQVQPNLAVLLQLSNPTNGLLVAPSTATLTILENGGSYVIPAGAQMVTNYSSLYNYTNGIIGSNDTVQILFALRDSAGLDVTNLNAYLLPTNGIVPVAPFPSSTNQNYGPLKVYGHSVSRPFIFKANGTNSFSIAPTFALYDNTKFIGTAVFNFSIGTWTTTFSNTAAIIINDFTTASPYPSAINVSGVGGTLIKAAVTFTNLSQTSPADIDALVSSPAQKNTLLMHLEGGQNAVNHITITFDDTATNSLPRNSVITNGVYKPTSFGTPNPFP